jgi:uncharacterized protein YdcH (DUF465 family)
LLDNLLLEQNFQIPLNQVNSTESQMAKLFLGLNNQMTARFNEIDSLLRLNTEKIAEMEKSQMSLKDEMNKM